MLYRLKSIKHNKPRLLIEVSGTSNINMILTPFSGIYVNFKHFKP